ncbi:hypothetical protein [uncultured Bacteroides sp.]|uniref:hypothetical protein n=1 Tax=uncultured Bacteroides sp. TaxID=162156 RepID=UPI002635499E|nr:hypothetical protein [uncultured Bacteroides sp.]
MQIFAVAAARPGGLRVIRVPFPAVSRDVACRVSPLAPVCYQYLFRVPIPAGDETRHATSLQGCALPADHYHALFSSVVIPPIRVIRVPFPYFSPRIKYPIPPSGYFPYVRGRA